MATTFTEMKKEEIIQKLKEVAKNSNIMLPSGIEFKIEGDKLIIDIPNEGIWANMQSNESAFEGWAFCLKAWLPDLIQKVLIRWKIPNEINKGEKLHYERFKYRVWKFIETYEWAENGSLFDLDSYKEEHKEWILNFPINEAKKKTTGEEALLERKFIETQKANYDVINQQLPVGVFDKEVKKENCVMPRGKSQIDIWAIKDMTLHIFELKTPKNAMIGIISELMYYVNIINDIKNQKIKYPTTAKESKYRNFDVLYNNLEKGNIKSIEGHFLTERLHPLISDNVIALINDSTLLNTNHVKYLYTVL